MAAFRAALRRFFAFSSEAARAAGLAPRQHQALLAIKGAPGRETLAMGEVASALMIRPHTAVELVDRLVQLGLVERRVDPDDHRRVHVALTQRAEAILYNLSAAHLRELAEIGPALHELMERF